MDPRINYVQEVLGFMFKDGFERKFEEVGSPSNDLEFWYRNALVFRKVTAMHPVPEMQKVNLVTLIEAIRFEAMLPPPFGEPIDLELSEYEFSEDVMACKKAVIDEVLRQEAGSRSTIDPLQEQEPPTLN
jgi:hypothetical protein